jgi:LAO/AO transport system kinase
VARHPVDAEIQKQLRHALKGNRRAISKLISLAENDPHARFAILSKLYWQTSKAHVIGITGPPGCGKSTLIAQLAKHYRTNGQTVGIVAVDPSSQITGGALLGDRIRMGELAADPKVFIRSMATRGNFGGIARATEDAVRILEAVNMDYVIVETAGAGQSDVDVKSLGDTIVVTTAPGLGDEIQALKAGIMEIGDIYVVNKADKENADRAAQEIYSAISMAEKMNGWNPRVLKTIATSGDGITALAEAIRQHLEYLDQRIQVPEGNSERLRSEILDAARRYFAEITLNKVQSSKEFNRLLSEVEKRRIDPYTAGRKLAQSKT